MAESIEFPGYNRKFEVPKQMGDVVDFAPPMFGHNNGVVTHTCWKLTPEELEEVNRTGEIWVAARCGNRPMQPHWVGSLSWIKRQTIDFAGGMWRPFTPKKPPEPA